MPNYVINKMKVYGSKADVAAFLERGKTEESEFSFEGFVPMPDSVFRGDLSMKDWEKHPGDLNWYDWSVNHWGTKWDACDVWVCPDESGKRATIEFQTAWSAPIPVFRAMQEQFPKLKIHVSYADEDLGSYCGKWANGNIVQTERGMKNPYRFARNLWGSDLY